MRNMPRPKKTSISQGGLFARYDPKPLFALNKNITQVMTTITTTTKTASILGAFVTDQGLEP